MSEEVLKLKRLIEASTTIMVTTHISPDPDALCSLLLAGTTLAANYPDKQILMSCEELIEDLKFLEGYQDIKIQPLGQAIETHHPDLIFIVDAMNFQRCTRTEAQTISEKVKLDDVRLVVIDHHEPEGVEPNDLYINDGSPAATQDVYQVLFHDLKLNKPAGSAQTALLGIISDTNRFMYDNPKHRKTFELVNELLDAGASIEELENRLRRFTLSEMLVLAELAANAVAEKSYSYSFISDEFKDQWFNGGKTAEELKLGCQLFVNDYIRNIDGNSWGFMVYPDKLGGPNLYSVSFRSVSGDMDVSKIARRLNGGGHTAAAGAKFTAGSINEAIDKVKAVIT